MTCWEALGKEEFFLPHLPKEKKSYLRSLLSHMMKWKIANRVNFFLYWTKSLCYNKEHYYFCFLVWWWHKVSQTIPLGGCVQPQEFPSHIQCREELLLMAEQKVSKLQNCFYYNIAQKQNHQNKSLFLQHHVASLPDSIFCPEWIQMTLNDTWCGASV